MSSLFPLPELHFFGSQEQPPLTHYCSTTQLVSEKKRRVFEIICPNLSYITSRSRCSSKRKHRMIPPRSWSRSVLGAFLDEQEGLPKDIELPATGTASRWNSEADTWQNTDERLHERPWGVKNRRARQKRTRCESTHGRYEKIVAYFACPLESCPTCLPPDLHPSAASDAIGSQDGAAHDLKLLTTLLPVLMQAICCIFLPTIHCLFFSLFLLGKIAIRTPDPDVPCETEARTEVEQQHSVCEAFSERLVRVIAFAANEAGDAGEKQNSELLEIRAKSKRVKEIMGESGCLVDEELYGTEIRAALRTLKE